MTPAHHVFLYVEIQNKTHNNNVNALFFINALHLKYFLTPDNMVLSWEWEMCGCGVKCTHASSMELLVLGDFSSLKALISGTFDSKHYNTLLLSLLDEDKKPFL